MGWYGRSTYLALRGDCIIVTVRFRAERSAWSTFASTCDATPLCKVLFTFCLADLDLLLLATTSQLFRLERILCLELGTTMLWDVTFGHDGGLGGRVISVSD